MLPPMVDARRMIDGTPDPAATPRTAQQIARDDALAARTERLDRWRRPLEGRRDRLAAWTNMMLMDHGFLRRVYLNLHKVSDNAWRAAQPDPWHIARFARLGIRSVVSLRGGQSYGSLPLERDACARHGIAFHNFVLRSRSVPDVADLQAAMALFETVEYPVLFHCKSGADRAGFMSALYLALVEDVPVEIARDQLALRFGHIRQGKTGVLDAFFDAYLRDVPDGSVTLRTWIETEYDREAVIAGFRPSLLGTLGSDIVLRRE